MSTPSASGRNRPPRPISAEEYDGLLIQDIASFLAGHAERPDEQQADLAVQRMHQLGLLHRAEHRYGIAGALHALMHAHPPYASKWRAEYEKMCVLADALKPSDLDSDITIVAQLDYLWVYASTIADHFTVDRLVRLGHRRDAIGDAVVVMIHAYAQHPLMIAALDRAARTTTTPPQAPHLPHAAILSLARYAASDPRLMHRILYVGWTGAALAVRTPDGQMPPACPTEWEGLPVVAQPATADELKKWRQLDAIRSQP